MDCMRVLLAAVAACLGVGCASQPVSGPTPATGASPVPASAQTAVPTPASAAATPGKGPVKYPGYKAKVRDGATVYCKAVTRTGSNFEDEYCLSAADIARLDEKAEEDRQHFRRNQTLCGTGGCGGT